MLSSRRKPTPLALEGVGRRVDPHAAAVAFEGRPVDVGSADIELGQALECLLRIVTARTQRRKPDRVVATLADVTGSHAPAGLASGEGGQLDLRFCAGGGDQCEPMREFGTAGVGRETQIGPRSVGVRCEMTCEPLRQLAQRFVTFCRQA